MPTVRNAHVLAPEPIEVEVAGVTYLVPGDLPLPTMFALDAFAVTLQSEEASDEAKERAFRGYYNRVLALFQVHQPDLEELPVGMHTLLGLPDLIYSEAAAALDEGDEADPTQSASESEPQAEDGPKTTPKPSTPAKSASRASSKSSEK